MRCVNACVRVYVYVRILEGVRSKDQGREKKGEGKRYVHSVTQSSLERPAEMSKWIHIVGPVSYRQ